MATDSKQIAALIHSGPGSQSLLDAAARARAHADELRAISTELRGASDRLSRGWQSPAADAATAKIVSLSSWYDQQAGHAEAAARVAENQAEVFNRTRSQIPKPEVFDDLQRRLEAANRANVAARGAYTPVITQLQTELQQAHSQTNAAYAGYQTRAADLGAGGSAPPPMTVQAVDFKQEFGDRDPRLPKAAVDPKNPYIGDERYGHWENVVPPPYVGKTPPPPATGHRDLSGFPGKGPAGSTGFYVPGGQTWIDDNAPPAATFQEQYRIRISGEDLTSYTRMVGGQQQQWVQYTYESQRWTKVEINELSGINPPPVMGDWNPITPQQISALSANNPSVTYYIPNGCGGQFTVSGGVPTSGFTPPIIPSMTAGR